MNLDGLVQSPPIAMPTIREDVSRLVGLPVPPDRARWMLDRAVGGDLSIQADLFRLMLDTWPRLAKAVREVVSVVKRISWQVGAAVVPGEDAPTELAQRMARDVSLALRGWAPKPGGFELTFEEALEALLSARTHGVSVLEMEWHRPQHTGVWVPRSAWQVSPRRYGWDPRGQSLGITDARGWSPFVPNKFLVGAWRAGGAPGSTALLRPLVPYWVGRTYGWQWLLNAAQLFGIPLRWATYEEGRPDVAGKVSDMLRNLGSAGWAAFPAGTQLQIHEAVTAANNSPQVVLQTLADEACDLLILGQRLSSVPGGGGLGDGTAQLQGTVRSEVISEAAWWVADLLSYQLVPSVLELNYGAAARHGATPAITPDLGGPDLVRQAERLRALRETGLTIPLAWAYEMSGVPMPDDGEATLPPPAAIPAALGPSSVLGVASPASGGHLALASNRREPQGHPGAVVAASVQAFAPPERTRVAERVFEDLTGVSRKWLGLVADVLERLIDQATSAGTSEEELAKALDAAKRRAPELFGEVEVAALAAALEAAMGAEMVNGAAAAATEHASLGQGGPGR